MRTQSGIGKVVLCLALPNQVHNSPTLLRLLNILGARSDYLVAPQTTGQKQDQDGRIPLFPSGRWA
jgi:hypothetical protein